MRLHGWHMAVARAAPIPSYRQHALCNVLDSDAELDSAPPAHRSLLALSIRTSIPLQGQAPGQLLLCNTAEAMRRIDKPAALQAAGRRLWADILSGAAEAQPQLLLGFLMLAFGDLKHWVFDYWSV